MPLYNEDLAYVQAIAFSESTAAVMPTVVERLRRVVPDKGSVVDLGCGAGASTAALVAAGFATLAVDASKPLLEIARQKAPTAEFHHGSIYEFQIPPCAAILALGEPLTYHAPDVDAEALLRTFFSRAADSLKRNGLLIFDVISSDGSPLDAKGWKSGTDWAIVWETAEDRQTKRLVRQIETFRDQGEGYRRCGETHHVKLFSPAQLHDWLSEAGFDTTIETSYGATQLAPRRFACFASRR